jgi:hypothetical protein
MEPLERTLVVFHEAVRRFQRPSFHNPSVQARAFERLMAGYDALAVEKSRWDYASPLAPPVSPPPPNAGRLKGRSAIDVVIYLSASREVKPREQPKLQGLAMGSHESVSPAAFLYRARCFETSLALGPCTMF